MDRLRIPERWVTSAWAVPVLFFGVALAAFGLRLTNLGYYMDDWHFVYYAHTFGVESLKELLLYDSRPYAAWLYMIGFKLFGFRPAVWQFASLILRTATAFALYLFFARFWGGKKRTAFSISLIFLVYPFFLLQPMAVAYFIHWVGFLAFALSLWMMLSAFEHVGSERYLLIGLALSLEGLHLFSSEFFAGLTLLRGLILWLWFARRRDKFFKTLVQTFLAWLPYLLIFGVYALWRGVLFVGPVERNAPVLIGELRSAPLDTVFSILTLALQDAIAIFFNGWQKVLSPAAFNLTSVFTLFALAVMAFMFIALSRLLPYFFMKEKLDENNRAKRRRLEAIALGLAALPLGELPIWVIGKGITIHANQMAATRFGMASMLGAAIVLAIAIEFFVVDLQKESILLALVVSLAVGVHLHNAHDFERSWEKQVNLYQQLSLRIPAMAPNTMLMAAGEVLFYMGEYPTSNALNTIYATAENTPSDTPYWFSAIYGSYDNRWKAFLDGMPISEGHLSSSFTGNSHDIIFLSYEPELQQCLWVLGTDASNLSLLSTIEQEAAERSALNRININTPRETLLPPDIFGTDIPNNWCSYYQRADLARQRGNWAEITQLWEEAQANEKSPANGFEYIPFIEGYAHTQNWAQVKKLTKTANKISHGMYHSLCPTLQSLEASTPASSERDAVISDLYDYLKCQ